LKAKDIKCKVKEARKAFLFNIQLLAGQVNGQADNFWIGMACLTTPLNTPMVDSIVPRNPSSNPR